MEEIINENVSKMEDSVTTDLIIVNKISFIFLVVSSSSAYIQFFVMLVGFIV